MAEMIKVKYDEGIIEISADGLLEKFVAEVTPTNIGNIADDEEFGITFKVNKVIGWKKIKKKREKKK